MVCAVFGSYILSCVDPSARGYNLGIQIRGPGPPGWGCLIWDSKIWPWVLRDFDLRVIALASTRSNCTVYYRHVLSSGRALQNNKAATVWKKFQGERKIGRGSQMGAWRLKDGDRNVTNGRWIKSRNTIILWTYHRHKLLDVLYRVFSYWLLLVHSGEWLNKP
jgi:hypothetical protein